MSKLNLKFYTIFLTTTVLFSISIASINNLSEQPKEISIKQQYEIDKLLDRCYDKCSGNVPLNYETILVDESINQKIDGLFTVAKRKQKEDELAEEARIAESIEIEKRRVARVEAEAKAERIRLAEIERIRILEAEKARLAKLEVERLKRQEERKQAKTQVASRSSGYQANYEMTFYTAFCPTGCTGVTSSGHDVSNTIYYQGYRIVAAPPNVKMYTKFRITFSDGSKIDAIVLDRGGAIKGKPILDLLVGSREEAYKLGRQQVKVEVIR